MAALLFAAISSRLFDDNLLEQRRIQQPRELAVGGGVGDGEDTRVRIDGRIVHGRLLKR